MIFEEYRGIYRRDIQVFAVGSCWSFAGFTVTEGLGWKPSSLAGREGLDVQKYIWKQNMNLHTSVWKHGKLLALRKDIVSKFQVHS